MCTWLLAFVGYFAVMQMMEANVYTKCYGAYCFFISNNSNPTTKLLSDAINECKQYNASLLTILNVDVQNKLEQFVTNGRKSGSIPNNLMDVWLKAFKQNPTWTWVNGQVYDTTPSGPIMDQGPTSYYNVYAYLGNGTRDNGLGNLINPQYGYHAFNPRFWWPLYICEIYDATVDTCSSQYNGNLLNGRCFKPGELSPTGSWFNARNACLAHGDLASFNNTDLNSLWNASWLDPTRTYWIGLNRNKWTAGGINDSEVKYTNWFQVAPANYGYSCISISLIDWTWTDCDCNGVHGVICYNYSAAYNPPSTVSTTNPPTSPSTYSTTKSTTTANSQLVPPTSTQTAAYTGETQTGDRFAAGIGVGIAIGVGVMMGVVVYLCCKLSKLSKSGSSESDRCHDYRTSDQEKETHNNHVLTPAVVEDRLYESTTQQQSNHIYDGLKKETQYEQLDYRT